jgi:hypothetical protein
LLKSEGQRRSVGYLVSSALLAISCALTSSATAAPPETVASGSATCSFDFYWNINGGTNTTRTSTDDLVVRLQPTGEILWDQDYSISEEGGPLVGPGDTAWGYEFAPDIGDPFYTGGYPCNAGLLPITATWYEAPIAPVTYDGRTTPTTDGSDEVGYSRLLLRVPGEGQYQASVSLTQGTIVFDDREMASSGTVDLGTLDEGIRDFAVIALPGPPAAWSVSFNALPVSVVDVGFSRPVIKPGATSRLKFTTSGDTEIAARIETPSGSIVRVLSDGHNVSRGSHSLIWDGRLINGKPVDDGRYRAVLQTQDPAGGTSRSTAPITVDGTDPETRITFGPRGRTRGRRPSFGFRANEPAGFECRLHPDLKRWQSCSSPKRYRLAKRSGRRVFQVRAEDEAGNTDRTPAKRAIRLVTN